MKQAGLERKVVPIVGHARNMARFQRNPKCISREAVLRLVVGLAVLLAPRVSFATAPTVRATTNTVVTGGQVQFYISNGASWTGNVYLLFYTNTTVPAHGSVGILAAWLWKYTSTAGFVGTDSFSWYAVGGGETSETATCYFNVTANNPPVAINSAALAQCGIQASIPLLYSHSDSGQLLTFNIIDQPAHGTAMLAGASIKYTSAAGFVGSDRFTWQVSDGIDVSGIATVTVSVTAAPPIPFGTTACVTKDTQTLISATYTGGGGYTCSAVTVTGPLHGSVTVTNQAQFAYTPTSGYSGTDSFAWRMVYSNETAAASNTITVTNNLVVKAGTGSDWPQWRCSEYRDAMTTMPMPAPLYLQWRRDFPAHTPEDFMKGSDIGYQPIVVGKTVVVNVAGRDKLMAFDTDTGTNKWVFYADGPVRVAAAANGDQVFAGSDDGYLYCLSMDDGNVIRKIAAGPMSRRVYGNDRLISPWMVRGGPALSSNILYFASGLWPMDGVFAYALNAGTGDEIWRNDSLGGLHAGQPHDGPPTVSGPSPQGYLVMDGGRGTLYVPGTEAYPAELDPLTGRLLYWDQMSGSRWPAPSYKGNAGYKFPCYDGTLLNGAFPAITVTTGSRVFTTTDATALGVSGTVNGMAAADGKLFIATLQGSLYCFGGTQVSPATNLLTIVPVPASNDVWTTNVQQVLAGSTEKEGCVMVWGLGTGRLVDELVLQAPSLARIVVIDPSAAKIRALRQKMDAAGHYGSRITAIVDDPSGGRLPPYVARLIVSEDINAAGYSSTNFLARLHYSLMPYGGMAWLPLDAAEHVNFVARLNAEGLQAVSVNRANPFSTLKRTSLQGGSNLKGTSIKAYDQTVKGPLGILWFDYWSANITAGSGDIFNGRLAGSKDAYTGLSLTSTTWDGVSGIAAAPAATAYVNPFTGLAGPGHEVPNGYGCGAGMHNCGYVTAGRAGTAAYHDHQTDNGTVHIAGVRSVCSSGSGVVGCGVLYEYTPGCGCNYSLRASLALAPMPEVENWSRWGNGPVQDVLAEKPLRRFGINFGAPADQMAPDGRLWKGYPVMCTTCPNVPMTLAGTNTARRYHHSSRIVNSEGIKWVSSSHVEGMTNFVVRLSQPAVALRLGSEQAPTIDGALSDACWDDRGKLLLCNNSVPSDSKAAYAWLRYDADNLYLSMTGPDCVPVDLGFAGEQNIRWHVYLSSRENVVSSGVNRYAHFAMSCVGNRYTYLGLPTGEDDTWAGVWSGAVCGVPLQPFAAEFAIPWSTVEQAGLWKSNLMINIYGPYGLGPGSGARRLRDLGDTGYTLPLAPIGSYGGGGVGCSRYVPLFYDAAKGDLAVPLDATVRLHFAETENATNVGARVFDVKLQGNTVLPDFDIANAAGGTGNTTVIREFAGLYVTNDLVLDLVPKTGMPLISGLEVEATYGARVNQPPAPVPDAGPTSGEAPLTVTFNGRRSSDDVGISRVSWNFGDGAVASGSLTNHTYAEAGTYTVLMGVTDSDGTTTVAQTNITVTGAAAPDFVCTIRATGGDYTNLSSWATAVASSLTNTDSLVFAVTDFGTYAAGVDDGAVVTFSGGATGVLKHINIAGMAYVTGCSGGMVAGPVACPSGSFTISDTGREIGCAVAECWNDWPDGLTGNVTISGWRTSASRYVKISAPPSQRHSGKPFKTGDAAPYSGFAVVGNITMLPPVDVRIEGLVIKGNVGLGTGDYQAVKGRVESCIVLNGGIVIHGDGTVLNSMIINAPGTGLWSSLCYGAKLRNVTVVSSVGVGVSVARGDGSLRNVLATGNGGGDFAPVNYYGYPDTAYCASGDGTAAAQGGDGNRTNQTFTFVDRANRDYHLAADDIGARCAGIDLSFDSTLSVVYDIDGEMRTGNPIDIGADQTPCQQGVDTYGIPDAWKIQYFGSATAPGSGALDDPDGDGMNNYGEWRAGTIPTNILSVLKVTQAVMSGTNLVIQWSSEMGKFYAIQKSTNLLNGFTIPVATNIPGVGGLNTRTAQVDQAAEYFRVKLE